ncbi:MAG TPA: LytTR family DNA-binding domain-containing protein [Candidatus Acidoferrales bacterium]|nr:LytTR family DNA-binding domain-containing protein [Candidatus Acidoferrales bacterium]
MIRTLVVDDEKLARDRLLSFLRGFDDIEIVGQAKNGVDAVRLIEEHSPDLVFLDVQMPGMDGFNVLKAVHKRPHVVFATAFDNYAIQAFEVHAVDYLLKPIARARVEEAVRRVRGRLNGHAPAPQFEQLVSMLEARERRYLPQLPVHRGRQILVLGIDQILWFEVEYRLVYAYVDGDRYMTNFTLKELEDKLDPESFFRAHKSRLVNLKHVKAIVPWFGGRYKLVMRDQKGSEVELSRAQARELRARMHW